MMPADITTAARWLPDRLRFVEIEETEAGHADEVGIERPENGAQIFGERSYEEIAETEPLVRVRRCVDPAVDARPGFIGRVEDGQRGEHAAQPQAVLARRSRQELD